MLHHLFSCINFERKVSFGSSFVFSGGSRISPRRGRQLPRGGRQHTIFPYFPKNCMKLKEFGPPGGCASLEPPLDPPLVLYVDQAMFMEIHFSTFSKLWKTSQNWVNFTVELPLIRDIRFLKFQGRLVILKIFKIINIIQKSKCMYLSDSLICLNCKIFAILLYGIWKKSNVP